MTLHEIYNGQLPSRRWLLRNKSPPATAHVPKYPQRANMRLLSTAATALLFLGVGAHAQKDLDPSVDLDSLGNNTLFTQWRPRYHFSAPAGWMNVRPLHDHPLPTSLTHPGPLRRLLRPSHRPLPPNVPMAPLPRALGQHKLGARDIPRSRDVDGRTFLARRRGHLPRARPAIRRARRVHGHHPTRREKGRLASILHLHPGAPH